MGIIQRQGFKTSIIGYVGVAIGVLSTLYVYPEALAVVGFFRSLFDTAVLLGMIVLLGSSVSAVRFFPVYQDKESGHKGFLTWLLLVAGAGFLLVLTAYPLLHQWMSDQLFSDRNRVFKEFIVYILPLTLFVALINLLSRYISNFRRITVPAIFEQLTIKISLPLLILMFLAQWITVKGVVIGIVASYGFAALGMIYYLWYLGEFRFTRPEILKDKSQLKEYARYSWYGMLTGMGGQIAFRIDGLMVSGMIHFEFKRK